MNETPPLDEFDVFERLPPLYAYFFKHHGGAPALRELLALPPKQTREVLVEAANELKAMKLPEVAKLVRQAARKAPREVDCCPYPDDAANATNRRSWLFSKRQKYGLCPWCGSTKTPEAICDNGEPCLVRWQKLCDRAPKPPGSR